MQAAQLTQAERAVITQFTDDLNNCEMSLSRGESVTLPGNIQQRFGSNMAAQYFEVQLFRKLNRAVSLIDDSDNLCVHVQLLQGGKTPHNLPTCLSVDTLTPETPKQSTNTIPSVAVGRKTPPRPMNCWLLYRYMRHKELKIMYPDLTVQEISTISSQDWRDLPSAKKNEWRAQAKDAKEEHERMYPDYKYQPRKPGQKKKRQSRKRTQSAAAASSSTTVVAPDDFNFNSSPGLATFNISTGPNTGAVADVIAANINDFLELDAAYSDDGTPLVAPTVVQPTLDHSGPDNSRPDIEAIRQDNLPNEFATESNADFLDIFGDEDFAFRDGADESATLPPFTKLF